MPILTQKELEKTKVKRRDVENPVFDDTEEKAVEKKNDKVYLLLYPENPIHTPVNAEHIHVIDDEEVIVKIVNGQTRVGEKMKDYLVSKGWVFIGEDENK